jgi:hypothetical protein
MHVSECVRVCEWMSHVGVGPCEVLVATRMSLLFFHRMLRHVVLIVPENNAKHPIRCILHSKKIALRPSPPLALIFLTWDVSIQYTI